MNGMTRYKPCSLVYRLLGIGNLKVIRLVSFMLLFCSPLYAANHYVRAGATGSANGSDWTNAYTDIPASLTRGDTYYIADGSYAPFFLSDKPSGTTVISILKATESAHGTDTGWNSTYGDGQADFKYNSTNEGTSSISNSYYVFDGITGGGPGSWKTGFGFKFHTDTKTGSGAGLAISKGTSNNIVRHIEIVGNFGDGAGNAKSNDGLYVGKSTNTTIEYIYIHDTGRTSIFSRASDITFRYSYFARNESTSAEHSEGASIWARAGDPPVDNTTFAYCVWEDFEGTGGIIYEGTGLKVYGNVFFHTEGSSASIGGNGSIGTWTASDATDCKIYNNTFVNINGHNPGIAFLSSPSTGNVAYNNLFYNSPNSNLFVNVESHDYNWFYNSSGTHGESNAQSGEGDPFVALSDHNFRLAVSTDPGLAVDWPFDGDPDGSKRGADGTWDRGAFENVDGAGLPSPPSNLRIVSQ